MQKQMLIRVVVLVAVIMTWLGWITPQVFAQPARVPQTGQTTSYAPGDDGDIQAGVDSPTPRFQDNRNGTVTDKLTGLIWLKNANCFPGDGLGVTWQVALNAANTLASPSCGLSDQSVAGDWRLPNLKELQSLLDLGQFEPALPAGHPFSGVQAEYFYYYWSSTTNWANPGAAWIVGMQHGQNGYSGKVQGTFLVWPVRGRD